MPAISEVAGWAGCAFTTTGLPAASADAVSPPATENASGKLLAPKTATGPSGRRSERTSGRGNGLRAGSAVSMRASTQAPAPATSAKSWSWPVVRPSSDVQARQGQAALLLRARHDLVAHGLEAFRDRAQEGGPRRTGALAP